MFEEWGIIMFTKFYEITKFDRARDNGGETRYIHRLLWWLRLSQCLLNKGILYRISRRIYGMIASSHGIEIDPSVPIGKGFALGHAYCITVNPNARIGENVTLQKGVTIGQENRGKRKGAPILGNNIWVGVNASLIGHIKIGNNVLIAPNTFVNCDVPNNSVVFGNPCIIKHNEQATRGYI